MNAVHVLDYQGHDDDGPCFDVIHPPTCPFDLYAPYRRHLCGVEYQLEANCWEAFVESADGRLSPDDLVPGLYLVRHWTETTSDGDTTGGIELLCSADDVAVTA